MCYLIMKLCSNYTSITLLSRGALLDQTLKWIEYFKGQLTLVLFSHTAPPLGLKLNRLPDSVEKNIESSDIVK